VTLRYDFFELEKQRGSIALLGFTLPDCRLLRLSRSALHQLVRIDEVQNMLQVEFGQIQQKCGSVTEPAERGANNCLR
jgi:hypothetical protein